MTFTTNYEVLNWYENQPRVLTDQFIESIEWSKVKDHPFDPKFIPVIKYMRDVETLTDMYHRELRRTPTGKDPVISKFMERWGVEEVTHGEVLNQFLNEVGVTSDKTWQSDVRAAVSNVYHINMYLFTMMTNLVGNRFTATHMTFGAVHEMTAAQSYRRLIELVDHPVLTTILKAIIREESAHTQFYWNMAKLELERSSFAQRMARFVIENFWYPVGQGSIPKERTAYTVATLFRDDNGIDILDKTVTKRVNQLPGFAGVTKMTEKIGKICRENPATLTSHAAKTAAMALVPSIMLNSMF